MAVFEGKRGFQRSPYHYDDRFGTRERLEDMQWQRGVLSKEVDTLLIGQREAAIMQVLQGRKEEASPDDKLKTPGSFDSDIILMP